MRNHILFLGAALLLTVFLFASCGDPPINYHSEARRLGLEIEDLGVVTAGTPEGDRHAALLTELTNLYTMAIDSNNLDEFKRGLSDALPAGIQVDNYIEGLKCHLPESSC